MGERQPAKKADSIEFAHVYYLILDMIGETAFGLGLSQNEYRRWTLSIPEQLKHHWDALDLSDAMLKFEGDGWLVFTPEIRLVNELCCLGIVMVRYFQDDMACPTGQPRASIPALRAAITSGMDLNPSLPNGVHYRRPTSVRLTMQIHNRIYESRYLAFMLILLVTGASRLSPRNIIPSSPPLSQPLIRFSESVFE